MALALFPDGGHLEVEHGDWKACSFPLLFPLFLPRPRPCFAVCWIPPRILFSFIP